MVLAEFYARLFADAVVLDDDCCTGRAGCGRFCMLFY